MRSGSRSYHNGLAAEDIALRSYQARGATLLVRRWKTPDGEIDLIVRLDDQIIFVEVKASKTHDQALRALGPKQQQRLITCAQQYLAQHASLNAACRFDLVAINRTGEAQIIENALQP